jgi:transcriptional regulator with XRE-family HTH domain
MANITNARQLGTEVRDARKKQGLSQEGLAARAGVSRAWLARFETGHPAASLAARPDTPLAVRPLLPGRD